MQRVSGSWALAKMRQKSEEKRVKEVAAVGKGTRKKKTRNNVYVGIRNIKFVFLEQEKFECRRVDSNPVVVIFEQYRKFGFQKQ